MFYHNIENLNKKMINKYSQLLANVQKIVKKNGWRLGRWERRQKAIAEFKREKTEVNLYHTKF